MDNTEGRDMNEQRTLVALDTDDSFFNDWMLDLYSLERCASDRWNDKIWSGVQPTYASILIREN
jgi:hypothetical protein